MDPTRTTRYRRPDPKGSSIMLGCDRNYWETTNKRIQKQVMKGSHQQGKYVRGERKMTSSRKRGMLDSTLSFGNAVNKWKTESKQHYHQHDLRTWGPGSKAQRDSYSWSDEDRRKLTALRDSNNAEVAPEISHYSKLPPIYAKPGNQKNGYQSDHSKANGDYHKTSFQRSNPRTKQRKFYEDEDDI